jgi:hypothetical protein
MAGGCRTASASAVPSSAGQVITASALARKWLTLPGPMGRGVAWVHSYMRWSRWKTRSSISNAREPVPGLVRARMDRRLRAWLSARPSRYLFIAGVVRVLGWFRLSPRGLYRVAARRGGWQLSIAVLVSLTTPIFAISFAMGQTRTRHVRD